MYTEQTSETQKLVGDNSNTDKKKKKYCIWGTFIAILIIAVIIIIVVVVEGSSDDDQQSGSSPIDWTSKFLELPSNETASNNSYHLTEFPHIAGTQQNNDYAQWLKDKLEDFGFESWLDQHENIYLSRYIDSSLQEIDPLNNSEILRDFNLDEGIIESDPTSSTELRSHAWIAYAATGQAIGPLAYVNYGSRKDFLNLTENGVNLTGTIGIVKYGGGMFRGQKAEQATEFGMIGLIIYSDPNDYGTGREEGIYPQGPWLPSTGYQRGSIIAGYMCPGNPSPDRLQDKCDKEFDEFMPSIPVIPMGYQNAYLLMSKMNGISVDSWQQDPDRSWQGGMNFTYHIGGYQDDINDEVWVNLEVENDNNATYTITNVVGKIEGDKYPDEHILIGNHFDAWIFGAADPISGTVASLEIARSFGEMIEDGWKPARSIYIAYWDAELCKNIFICI